jgi:serine/threonine-protein kinase
MGLVFRGWDPSLKRSVALKTLRLDRFVGLDQRQAMISRLLDEAVTVARFSHPNIVAVYDVAHGSETAFMAMEYVDGISLADLLEGVGTLNVEQALALGYGIASGLAAAHEHRVVHHDVKPGNVLLGRQDSVKVTDFGVSQMITVLAKERDKVFGTPGYLPPEALLNEGYEETGDLFGLGAVLYQSLTGEPAIRGRNIHQIMLNTVRGPITPPHQIVPEIPRELEELVLRLLARAPTERPQSAAEVARIFQELAGEVPRWHLPEDLPLPRKSAKTAPPSRLLTPMDSKALDPTTPLPPVTDF